MHITEKLFFVHEANEVFRKDGTRLVFFLTDKNIKEGFITKIQYLVPTYDTPTHKVSHYVKIVDTNVYGAYHAKNFVTMATILDEGDIDL